MFETSTKCDLEYSTGGCQNLILSHFQGHIYRRQRGVWSNLSFFPPPRPTLKAPAGSFFL